MGNFELDKSLLLAQRSFVNGRIDDVKTEYSQDYVPIHELLMVLLDWIKGVPAHGRGLGLPNPVTRKPLYPSEMQKPSIKPMGVKL